MIKLKDLNEEERKDYDLIKDKTFKELEDEKVGDHPFIMKITDSLNKLFEKTDKMIKDIEKAETKI